MAVLSSCVRVPSTTNALPTSRGHRKRSPEFPSKRPVRRLTPSAQMPSADEAEHPPLRQILLPVDGTPNSEVMVDWALSEFCRKGDQINLLHVIPKCVVHYELPLDSIRPRVYARAPRTPRLSSDRNRARGSERDDDTRHPIASSARRYAPSSTMYGFEEYVIDVPDPEQVASSDVHLSHFERTRARNFLSPRLIISVSLRYRERNSPPFLEPGSRHTHVRHIESAGGGLARGRRAVPRVGGPD